MTLYRPTHFRVDDEPALLAFIEAHGFGTLVSAGARGLDVSHIPFVPERGADGRIRLLAHVARANAQWEALAEATHVVAIFEGPHAYVSPTWYAEHPSVPTWNYAVVHAHGRVRLMEEAGLRALLERLSRTYEAGRPNAWRLSDQPEEYIARMLRAIVGFELEVERLEGKFKLSQNRPAEIPRVIAALEAEGQSELAGLMRIHTPKPKSKITP
jgi:transcriptional regulator